MTSPSSPDTVAPAEALNLPPVTSEALLLGVIVIVSGYVLGRLARWATRRILRWRGRSPSASAMFGTLAQAVLIVLSVAAALTLMFPSVKPVNALGGIGVLSIAAGIAFQTVLGNMFAGIVILARDIFRVGDQIAVEDVAGTVIEINLTNTAVRTFDGRKALIPNSVIHSQVVAVQTGFEHVRSTISLDIDDRSDFALAINVAEEAMRTVPVVLGDPPPQALLQSVGSATVQMDLRFWSGARQMETRVAQHQVIVAVLQDLADAGVVTGSDVLVVEGGPQLLSALQQPEDAP